MAIDIEIVQAALKDLIDPNTQRDYVSTRSASNIRFQGSDVSVDIAVVYPAQTQLDELRV